MSTRISFIGIIFFALFAFGFEKSNHGIVHPNEDEVLSFDFTNVDAGVQSMTSDSSVCFPFVNHSGHDITIESIVCNNKDFSPYYVRSKSIGVTIKNGQRDTIIFQRTNTHNMREGLIDNSWTINFEGMDKQQHLNIFCELKHTSGKLVAESIELPTANRGDTIRFELPVTNIGETQANIVYNEPWPMNQIRLLDELPIKINPDETRLVHYELITDNLLNNYTGKIGIKTDEEGYYPWLYIPFSGKLISKNHPSIKFDSLELHLNINQGDEAVFHFWFENDGDQPLVISWAKTSCGCLVATWPKEPIMPGERKEISIKYDSNRVGPINKSCSVLTNASNDSVYLRVKGNVTPKDVPEMD